MVVAVVMMVPEDEVVLIRLLMRHKASNLPPCTSHPGIMDPRAKQSERKWVWHPDLLSCWVNANYKYYYRPSSDAPAKLPLTCPRTLPSSLNSSPHTPYATFAKQRV
ncbi:hypothetical protein E2C01_027204 [Portunus trituberculatus]|uniref:Uncharacterized protein n=1 Tax=Portunus trituberculatus TaxID=210409 RepID=A0A5B7EKH9_PORTR|nr:hypothetical protein [Portunus trituberculatus]